MGLSRRLRASCAASPEWLALREDAGRLVEKYGVVLSAGLGDENVQVLACSHLSTPRHRRERSSVCFT